MKMVGQQFIDESFATAGLYQGRNAPQVAGGIVKRGQHEHNQPYRRELLTGTGASPLGDRATQPATAGSKSDTQPVQTLDAHVDHGNVGKRECHTTAFALAYQFIDIGRVQGTVHGAKAFYQTPYELLTAQSFEVTDHLLRRKQGGEFYRFGLQDIFSFDLAPSQPVAAGFNFVIVPLVGLLAQSRLVPSVCAPHSG